MRPTFHFDIALILILVELINMNKISPGHHIQVERGYKLHQHDTDKTLHFDEALIQRKYPYEGFISKLSMASCVSYSYKTIGSVLVLSNSDMTIWAVTELKYSFVEPATLCKTDYH